MSKKQKEVRGQLATVLNEITIRPGMTPQDLTVSAGLVDVSSVSSACSILYLKGLVGRVPNGRTYQYWAAEAAPQGVEFNRKRGDRLTNIKRNHGSPPEEKPRSVIRADILISIPVAKNETMTVTLPRAREIFLQLKPLFDKE